MPAPHGCLGHVLRCVPSRCVHVYAWVGYVPSSPLRRQVMDERLDDVGDRLRIAMASLIAAQGDLPPGRGQPGALSMEEVGTAQGNRPGGPHIYRNHDWGCRNLVYYPDADLPKIADLALPIWYSIWCLIYICVKVTIQCMML